MHRHRRFLPSISLLAAFEGVMESGSTMAAASELSISQGAISRLIANLENQLGQQLFERHRQRLIPTQAAKAYFRDVTRALDLIQRASMLVAANPEGGSLSLAILPAFGTRWLAPRLGGFLQKNPGISLNLATRLRRFNFAAESFDAAIHFGQDDWRRAHHLKLFDEQLTACAAPALLANASLSRPEDISQFQLLQLETRPNSWEVWFAAQGCEASPPRGMVFDQYAPMIQTALSGLGVALLPQYLAEVEIAEKRLVPLFRAAVEGTGAYWLVWPEEREDYPPLTAFRSWIAEQTGATATP